MQNQTFRQGGALGGRGVTWSILNLRSRWNGVFALNFSVVLHCGKAPGTRWEMSQVGFIAIQDVVWMAKDCASAGNHTAMIQPVASVHHRQFSFFVVNLKVHFICISSDILCTLFSYIFIDLIWLASIIASCVINKQDCRTVYSMT